MKYNLIVFTILLFFVYLILEGLNYFVFIDGEDPFRNLNNKLSIFHHELPTHYNELGYRLMAEHLFNNLKK